MRILILVKILILSSLVFNVSAKEIDEIKVQPKIIGGTDVSSRNSPYGFFAQLSVGCGGAHIGNGVVLTAAHCVEGLHGHAIEVRFPHDPNFSDYSFESIHVTSHPGYVSVLSGYDAAIIKINDFQGQYPESIELLTNTQYENFTVSQPLEVIGYGVTEQDGAVSSVMQHANVYQVSDSQCEADYAVRENRVVVGSNFIDTLMMCAAAPGKDSCQGDSGGPLLYFDGQDYYHTGIVSFGYGCANPDYPGVYTRTDYLNEWISEFVEKVIYTDFYSSNAYMHPGINANNQMKIEFTNLSLNSKTISDFDLVTDLSWSGCELARNYVIEKNEVFSCVVEVEGLQEDQTNELQLAYSFLSSSVITDIEESIPLFVLNEVIYDNSALLNDLSFYDWAESSEDAWEFDGEFKSTTKSDYGTSILSISGFFEYGLEFDFSMESELGYDLFMIAVDGEIQTDIIASGVCIKQKMKLSLPAGNHRVAFIYSKDYITDVGDDEVIISNLKMLEQETQTSNEPHCYLWREEQEGATTTESGSINWLFALFMLNLPLFFRRMRA